MARLPELAGVAIPPFGAVMIVDLILLNKYSSAHQESSIRSSAFIAWAIGTFCATVAHIGLFTGVIAYYVITLLSIKPAIVIFEGK